MLLQINIIIKITQLSLNDVAELLTFSWKYKHIL